MFNFRSRLFNKKCLLKPSKNKSDENIAAIEDDYNTANMRREWQKTKVLCMGHMTPLNTH